MLFYIQRNFLSRKIFRENLNEIISLAEMDVAIKVTSNEIASFRLPQKIVINRKLSFTNKPV